MALPDQRPPPWWGHRDAEEGARAATQYLSAAAKARVWARCPACAARTRGTRAAPAWEGQEVSAWACDDLRPSKPSPLVQPNPALEQAKDGKQRSPGARSPPG